MIKVINYIDSRDLQSTELDEKVREECDKILTNLKSRITELQHYIGIYYQSKHKLIKLIVPNPIEETAIYETSVFDILDNKLIKGIVDSAITALKLDEKLGQKLNGSDVINVLDSDEIGKPLSAKQGKMLKELIDSKASSTVEVVNSLDSDDESKALSAKQGKVLNGLVSEKLSRSDVVNNFDSEEEDKPLSASKGKELNDAVNALHASIPDPTEIADNLTTDSDVKALSARQGKVLHEKIKGIQVSGGGSGGASLNATLLPAGDYSDGSNFESVPNGLYYSGDDGSHTGLPTSVPSDIVVFGGEGNKAVLIIERSNGTLYTGMYSSGDFKGWKTIAETNEIETLRNELEELKQGGIDGGGGYGEQDDFGEGEERKDLNQYILKSEVDKFALTVSNINDKLQEEVVLRTKQVTQDTAVVNLSESNNFVLNLSADQEFQILGGETGQTGTIVIHNAQHITGYNLNCKFKVKPTGLNNTEVFAYYVVDLANVYLGVVL